ncbi:hypothetical protein N9383_02630 [Granulosicoccus sp.]|nr:hypothetical protein [Granulosicoccus sp.]
MNSSIDDNVEIIATIFSPVWLFPALVLVVGGALMGVAMVVWSFSRKKTLKIDYFGLSIGSALIFLYFLMPIGLRIDNRKEPLDVMRHGYFSTADIYTWVLVCLVVLTVSMWSLMRIYKARKDNFGGSLLLYAVINLAAVLIGWEVASEYGGAWTS